LANASVGAWIRELTLVDVAVDIEVLDLQVARESRILAILAFQQTRGINIVNVANF